MREREKEGGKEAGREREGGGREGGREGGGREDKDKSMMIRQDMTAVLNLQAN